MLKREITMRFFRRQPDSEIDAELQSHLQMSIRDRVERGEPEDEARAAALREFGNLARAKEDTRSVWNWTSLEQLLRDLRSGASILWRSPALSITAICLMALVVGGNTAIYSIIHALLSRPAPGVEAKQLAILADISEGWNNDYHKFANYTEYAAQTQTLHHVIAAAPERFTLTTADGGSALTGAAVTTNFFSGLGVRFEKGRMFIDADETLDPSGLVAVIGHRIWQERFQGADDVVGRPITINGHRATIVGVAPPRFRGPTLGYPEDVWVPAKSYFRITGRERELTDRTDGAIGVVILGQLKPGVSIDEARAELATIAGRVRAANPASSRNLAVMVYPYVGAAFGGLWEYSARFLAIFSVATAITLIVVCANVSNLLLARAVVRQRETAVRQSLGASRGRIIRMLLAEGLTLALLAWVCACLIAYWISMAAPELLNANMSNPSGLEPNHLNIDYSPDWQVLAYAMLLVLVCSLSFTASPAVRLWQQDVLPALRAGEPGVARGRTILASALVVAQLAFSVLLLTTAGLASRSLSFVSNIDLGFDKTKLLLVSANPSLSTGNREVSLGRLEDIRERLKGTPGVAAVTYTRMPAPFVVSNEPVRIAASDQPVVAMMNFIGPDYLETLGLHPLAGREFTPDDRLRTNKRALINKNLADSLFERREVIGQTVLLGNEGQAIEIIGVIPNALYSGFESNPRPNYVLLAEQQESAAATLATSWGLGETTFYIRHTTDLNAIVPSVVSAIRQVDPQIPIASSRSMELQLDRSEARIVSWLLTLFSTLSLTIALMGQYAVIAFNMRRRTREFGIRAALGASSMKIVMGVLREGLGLTVVGLLVGFVLSAGAGTAIRGALYGVTPTDAITYLRVFAVLSAASVVACYLPARRASRIDPLVSLRCE